MTQYLFIGGALNGTMREVPDDTPVHKAFVPPDTNPEPTNGGVTHPAVMLPYGGAHATSTSAGLVIQAWIRRVMTATDPTNGDTYRNVVYIHETLTEPALMFAALANHLALTWARTGEKVIDAPGN